MKPHQLPGLLTVIVIAANLAGCRASKTTAVTSDTTTADYCHQVSATTETITLPDTLTVALQPQSETVVTRDSISTLVNDYATSRVSLNADGTLTHSLSSRGHTATVPITRHLERTDTLTTTNHTATSTSTTTDGHKCNDSRRWPVSAVVVALLLTAALVYKFKR